MWCGTHAAIALTCWVSATSLAAGSDSSALSTDDLAEAKQMAVECDAVAADKRTRTVGLMEVESDVSGSSSWQRVPTGGDSATGHSFTVRLKNERIRVVQSHRSAPSGDWELDVTYCFRDDGTLASLTSELRTFEGDVIIQHSRFFRPNGQTLQDSKEVLDLNSRKPLRGKSGNYMDRKFRVYQKAEDVLAEVGRDRVYP